MNIQAIASPLTQGEKIALAERLLPHVSLHTVADSSLIDAVIATLLGALAPAARIVNEVSDQRCINEIHSLNEIARLSRPGAVGADNLRCKGKKLKSSLVVEGFNHGSIPGKTGVDQVSLGSKSPREATSSKARNGVRK